MRTLRDAEPSARTSPDAPLVEELLAVRAETLALCAPLEPDDYGVQSMPDVSPPRWHLAHTTWFFEEFVLARAVPKYAPYHPRYAFLFNSYYEAVGERVARDRRGTLSRPTTREVLSYRAHVDARLREVFAGEVGASRARDLAAELTLGIHHEQQHQELLITDIKHILATNPLRPAYMERPASDARHDCVRVHAEPLEWVPFDGGVKRIGRENTDLAFAFDNERPQHAVYLEPFTLASRPATCGEWLAFMEDGGYRRAELWLSDGWAAVSRERWEAPLYWEKRQQNARGGDCGWSVMTLAGMRDVDPDEAVCHVSYYEADAFARWSGARLPTEAEWETAALAPARTRPTLALESRRPEAPRALHPRVASRATLGDVWQWTSSAYASYPGFIPLDGALGEYNAKFMCGQMVLRGGSCATPRGHARASYRNFFPPATRWQLSGVRLAR
jgi:ergothioneine biosynthesis protein EgtB